MDIQIPICPLSLWERARVRVNCNSVIPTKGDLCITTVIPAKAGTQGWGRLIPIKTNWTLYKYEKRSC